MTRKDYIFLAEVFRAGLKKTDERLNTYDITTHTHAIIRRATEDMARLLAKELARDNPRFDQHLFLQNAGVRSLGI